MVGSLLTGRPKSMQCIYVFESFSGDNFITLIADFKEYFSSKISPAD